MKKRERTATEVAQAIVKGIGKDIVAGMVEYANLVERLAKEIPLYELDTTEEIKKRLAASLPKWSEEQWEDLRAAVQEKAFADWDAKEKTVTMTWKDWNRLTTYLLMSTKHREGEAQAWERLAQEKEEDGTPRFIHAASNAAFWREMITDIERIREAIDRA